MPESAYSFIQINQIFRCKKMEGDFEEPVMKAPIVDENQA